MTDIKTLGLKLKDMLSDCSTCKSVKQITLMQTMLDMLIYGMTDNVHKETFFKDAITDLDSFHKQHAPSFSDSPIQDVIYLAILRQISTLKATGQTKSYKDGIKGLMSFLNNDIMYKPEEIDAFRTYVNNLFK